MTVKSYKVILCERKDIKDFIESNHYSKSINGCNSQYSFKLIREDQIIGAAFFGRMAMAGQWKRFADFPEDVIELRRLCCIDDTPKNTESYFIGKMLRWLKKNTSIKKVVSYADTEHGHQGTIYKASNFTCLGKKPGAKVLLWNGKQYHDKSMRTFNNGVQKPFSVKLKEAYLRGEVKEHKTSGKYCYVYNLR